MIIDDNPSLKRKMSDSSIYPTLISETEFRRIKATFEEQSDQEYKDAQRKRTATDISGVPKWFWIILLWFAYDDILG